MTKTSENDVSATNNDLLSVLARIIDPQAFELIEHYSSLGKPFGEPYDEEGTFKAYPQLRKDRDLAFEKAADVLRAVEADFSSRPRP